MADAKPKTIAQLQAEYDAALKDVTAATTSREKLEKQLLDEVKAKLDKQTGDFDALMKRKLTASIALNDAKEAEKRAKAPPAPKHSHVQDVLAGQKVPAAPRSVAKPRETYPVMQPALAGASLIQNGDDE